MLNKTLAAILLLTTIAPASARSWVDGRGYYHRRGPSHHHYRPHRPRGEWVRVGRHRVKIVPDEYKFTPVDEPEPIEPAETTRPAGPYGILNVDLFRPKRGE